MAESFTVRWQGGQDHAQSSESAALASAFAHIREGAASVTVERPDGSEIHHDTLLVMMAAD